jgi:hypothetical protein
VIKKVEGRYGFTDKIEWLVERPGFKFEKLQTNGLNGMSLVFNQNQIKKVGNIHDGFIPLQKEIINKMVSNEE